MWAAILIVEAACESIDVDATLKLSLGLEIKSHCGEISRKYSTLGERKYGKFLHQFLSSKNICE